MIARALTFLALLVFAAAASAATPAKKASQAKEELKELRSRIEGVQRRIAEAEETKTDTLDQLRESERAISDANRALSELTEQSLTAYEIAYSGTFQNRTTVGIAFYVDDTDNEINFVQLPSSLDPYTATNPPPGWQLPPSILSVLAARGIFLPRTAFTYLNLGPVRQTGLELSLDHRFSKTVTAFANYSWQGDPTVLSSANPYPASELVLPPTNRFNVGANMDGARFIAAASVNYSDKAFWTDVLSAPFHGFTDAYTLVNGTFGVKWMQGRVSTVVKVNNLLNKDIQQHVFGDILKRSALLEVRINR